MQRALTTALGEPVQVRGRRPLGGGCISRVEQIDTNTGRYVLKSMTDAPVGFFAAEAAGLTALAGADSGLLVPRPIAWSPAAGRQQNPEGSGSEPTAFIVIEFLPPGETRASFHEDTGCGLAALHRMSHAAFGFDIDTFCGATRQANPWTSRWVPFYTASRIMPQVRMATDAGRLDRAESRRLDRLATRLGSLLTEPEAGPALIHGDLWPGNLHVAANGSPAILDPAVSFAHREAEFGMMRLFGGFPQRVFDAYDDVFPREAGWSERQPLYELYHLLNHLNLFGAGYHAPVMAIVARYD